MYRSFDQIASVNFEVVEQGHDGRRRDSSKESIV